MTEFIPPTSETESETRHFWDNIIRGYVALSDIDEEIDLFWVLDNLKDEDTQAGLDELYGNFIMLTVPEGQSTELEAVEEFLRGMGFLEGGEDEI